MHQHIIDECLRGNRAAQHQLYRLYSKAMYNVSFRIVKNSGDAEDVLQDAFVSAFKNLKSFKGESSFGAWLKRIVINKSLNFLNKRSIDVTPLENLPEYGEEDEETFYGELSVERIKDAVEKLPEGYRLVFSLYLLEGYDHSEIGEILGISESTSKSQFNRSKKKLRELLQVNG
ncbi:MAG: RNA polymerase sigma factor [Fulvivirga sp.]|uniref:RNA polymerase sigma factor n=1 Tax=Fulvivirga sp. TaxID=1931237 RepID=UPI0032EBBDA8